jgi:hypothetical protein
MNLAILIVEGTAVRLDEIERLLNNPSGAPISPVEKPLDSVSSRASLTIADAENPVEMMSGIRRFLACCQDAGVGFPAGEGSAELSIGVAVGSRDQFVAGVDLSLDVLSALVALGISISVTAYPASDD